MYVYMYIRENTYVCVRASMRMVMTDEKLLFVFSGAEFGLRLTLNIEQYEYMPGPNSKAGIKVVIIANVQLVIDLYCTWSFPLNEMNG